VGVRSNQRHLTKYDTIVNIPGKPNPIKQWRKQLAPYVISNNIPQTVQSKQKSIQDVDDAIKTTDPPCEGYQNILFTDYCKGIESNHCVTGSFKVKYSANTIINKNFCWNTKQYLQKRCKTYDQNQTLGKHLNGSEYQSASPQCVESCNVIYKPNNSQFKNQGAVSSSGRIAKLKYDTIRSSTAKYDSFLANLDNSNTVLCRKPVKCINWVKRGVRKVDSNVSCPKIISLNNI
jgi:hypothetical protein